MRAVGDSQRLLCASLPGIFRKAARVWADGAVVEGLAFAGTAQRPALVHVTARANAERIRWFRVTERNDSDAARDYMPPALADSLSPLPNYVCIQTSDAGAAFRDESMVGKIKVLGAPPAMRKGRK